MRIKATARRTFENWEKEILRPVVANLLTAAIAFVVALFNDQFRGLVFGRAIEDYPLICRAEAYTTPQKTLAVDLLIINRSEKGYSRDELIKFLKDKGLDTRTSVPELKLKFWRDIGRFGSPTQEDFNVEKGTLVVTLDEDRRGSTIVVQQIDARAILKVVYPIEGIPDRPENRATDTAVPFTIDTYLDACYEH